MSSLAAVPRRAASGPAQAAVSARAKRSSVSVDFACGLGLATMLTLFAFVTGGGVDLQPNTWAEVALVALAAALSVVAVLFRVRGRGWGALTAALFGLLAAFTAVSIAWSVQPDNSWIEANRTASYLAAFGAAVLLARLVPDRWRALVGAVGLLATALSVYALLVKVFPATLDPGDLVGRVKAPFDYWNAVGLLAGLGVPSCLWAGSRTSTARAMRALSVPALTLLLSTVVLSYSRSALFAAVIGTILWFALVPLRLRAAATFATAGAGAAIITVWALSTHALTRDGATTAARTAAGHAFGLVLVFVLVAVTLAGFVVAYATDRFTLPAASRRHVGTVLIAAVAMVPVAALAVTASQRGLGGEISHVWKSLNNSSAVTGDVPGRLVELSSSRSRYWSEALRVGDHSPLAGAGAGAYGIARSHYSVDPWIAGHAHSYVFETFADLGLIGVLISFALLIAWGCSAARPLRRGPPSEALELERAGIATLLCAVVVFGVSSALDWTWFVPGTAVPALMCAGWLAGRGPLHERAALDLRAARNLTTRPAAVVSIVGIALLTVVCVWAIYQPLHSTELDAAAIAAVTNGDGKTAVADGLQAISSDPVAVDPHFELSAIYSSLGNEQAAHSELAAAVHLQPKNPGTWRQLGIYDLQHNQPRRALAVLRKAQSLDRSDTQTMASIAQANSELHTQPAAP